MLALTPMRVHLMNLALLLMVSPASAGIVVLAGGGGVHVYDIDGNVGDGVSWNQPGTNQVEVHWQELYASGTFEFATDDDTVMLTFDGTHSVRRTTQEFHSEMHSSIGGGFWVMSDLGLLVSAEGAMTFSLHGQEDPGAGMAIWIDNQNQDTIHQISVSSAYGPPDGSIKLVDSILLDGGAQYFINIGSDVSQSAVGFSELPSTATSGMTLTIQAVPEPVTILLLALGSLVGFRRNSSRQS